MRVKYYESNRYCEKNGRVVIPKEIRRTMRIREGDPMDNSLTLEEKSYMAIHSLAQRIQAE